MFSGTVNWMEHRRLGSWEPAAPNAKPFYSLCHVLVLGSVQPKQVLAGGRQGASGSLPLDGALIAANCRALVL